MQRFGQYSCGKTLFSIALPAILVFAFAAPGFAQSPGFDLFQTGSGASVDLTSVGLGVVSLNGVPIQTITGNTDTMMQRTTSVPPGGGAVTANLYAVYMMSASPVTYNGQAADVYITVNATNGDIPQTVLPQVDTLPASTGTVTVSPDGTFSSNMTINADVIIVVTGTSPTQSGNILGHQPAPAITLTSSNSTWSSTAPAGYPSVSKYPSGGFYGRPKHQGPHPVIPGSCSGGGLAADARSAALRGPGALMAAPVIAQPVCVQSASMLATAQ
jgi:hypothetical protein